MGYAGPKLHPDTFHHAIEVIPHRHIGEPQRPIAFAKKHGVADLIMLDAVLMGPPIDLDDQPAPVADKVEKIAAEGSLPAEVPALGA